MTTIPSHQPQITSPDFLERQLFAEDLLDFINMARAYRGDRQRSATELIGNKTDQVLQRGLAVLSTQEIQSLLDSPGSLLELQDLIYDSGSSYWDPFMSGQAQSAMSMNLPAELFSAATDEQVSEQAPRPVTANAVSASTNAPRHGGNRWNAFAKFAAAACVLLAGVLSYDALKPILFPDALSDSNEAFLAMVDDLERDQFLLQTSSQFALLKVPQDKSSEAELTRRADMFAGLCTRFSRSAMHQLSPLRRDLLKEKCDQWLQSLAAMELSSGELTSRVEQFNQFIDDVSQAIRDLPSDQQIEAAQNA